MKKLRHSLLSLLITWSAMGQGNLYDQLLEVNAEWAHQSVAAQMIEEQAAEPLSDRAAIARHLKMVQGFLLSHQPAGLNAEQQKRRARLLCTLTPYYQNDWYPVNDVLPVRRPIFIDRYDHFCAVGFLMKQSGHEDLARCIAAKMNYAYLREMNWQEIGEWAQWAGFTIDELAWIQPGYPPNHIISPLGQGTNGRVLALEDTYVGGLMVGGDFTMVNGSLPANYIAEWQPGICDFFHWIPIANPLNSPVKVILRHSTNYYIGGDFQIHGNPSSVYSYNKITGWTSLGQLSGQVEDLIFFDGVLYAVGLFSNANPPGGNQYGMARWNGSAWQLMMGNVNGTVRAAIEFQGLLYLGGDFNQGGSHVKKWNGTQFAIPGITPIRAPVYDFSIFHNQLYAAGSFYGSAPTDTFGIARWNGNDWHSLFSPYQFGGHGNNSAFYDLEVFSDRLFLAGAFELSPIVGIYSENLVLFNDLYDSFRGICVTDEPVRSMAGVNDQSLYFGGDFTLANTFQVQHVGMSSFGLLEVSGSPTPFELVAYPNPTRGSLCIQQPGEVNGAEVRVYDLAGRSVHNETFGPTDRIDLDLAGLTAGSYLLELKTASDSRTIRITKQ